MAAADIFLAIKGPDIKGESQDDKHKDMIECLTWSWAEANMGTAGTGGGAGAGAVSKQDLIITKHVDKSSNNLFQGCATGTHYGSATLYVRKAGGDPLDYLQIDLGAGSAGAVFISGYNVAGASNDGVIPVETVSINFATMMMTYNQQAKTGGGAGAAALGYDFGASKKL